MARKFNPLLKIGLDYYESVTEIGDLRYLKLDQTTPQTTIGTFTFPSVVVTTTLTAITLTDGTFTVSSGDISAATLALTTPLTVANGGTGKSSWTQYAIPYASASNTLGEIEVGTPLYYLQVNGAGTGYQWAVGSGGVSTFLDLTDTPDSYTGYAGLPVRVNSSEDALEFAGHNLLSAAHPDTTADTVVRGDILYGDSTPKWKRLAIGTSGKFVRSDGTDVAWTAIAAGDLPSSIDAAKIADGTVSNTEFQYINSLTSNAQTQLDAKVNNTGNETIAGVKTFSSFLILPSSSPTTSYEAAHKKYVDDLVAVGQAWQEPVIDKDLDTPPGSPSIGDRYIVDSKGNDAIAGINDAPLAGDDYFILTGDQSGDYASSDKILVRGSTANDGFYSVSGDNYYNTGSDTITAVDQNVPAFDTDDVNDFLHFEVGDTFDVSGSTGNDGTYTVAALSDNGRVLRITTVEVIPDPTPDGQIDWTYNRTNVLVSEAIGDTTVDGNIHFAGGAWSAKGVSKIVEYNGATWDVYTPESTWWAETSDDSFVYQYSIADPDYDWELRYSLAIYDFQNGLTETGSVVELGGSLTENTTITLESYNLNFDIIGSGYVGIDTSSPTSYLTVNGSFAGAIVIDDGGGGSFILDETHHTYIANILSVGGAFYPLYLPTASNCTGREYIIKKWDNTNYTLRVTAFGTELIDDKDTYDISTQYHYIVIRSDGSNWNVTSRSKPYEHQSTHNAGSTDPLKLDDLATPDDNTDLNASTTRHGLLRKLDNDSTHYLDGQGGWTVPSATGLVEEFGISIDGAGVVITTGSKGYTRIKYAATITAWTVLANQSGSIEIDVRKCNYEGFPTTTSIAGTELPTLSSEQKNEDTDLTTWTTAVTAGDIIEFVVNSVATVTRVNLIIKMTRA
jgi:hypothetical protein